MEIPEAPKAPFDIGANVTDKDGVKYEIMVAFMDGDDNWSFLCWPHGKKTQKYCKTIDEKDLKLIKYGT